MKTTFPPPWYELEDIFFRPSIFFNSFSIGLTKSLSESLGEIPLWINEI